ncbi:increased DNA methylation 1-like [Durio zibethinus]|uniref:Increased DNA methylation 1-like n=1 Tax=Durio zibethinus TaxID=66656 RepID=A0A6P6BJ69_DURZI|nr:increased DNA methylation 1-like [Durio zibethinus]
MTEPFQSRILVFMNTLEIRCSKKLQIIYLNQQSLISEENHMHIKTKSQRFMVFVSKVFKCISKLNRSSNDLFVCFAISNIELPYIILNMDSFSLVFVFTGFKTAKSITYVTIIQMKQVNLRFRKIMTYNLRDRNLMNIKATYLGSSGSDNDSHDEATDSDPDFGRPPPMPNPNQNNVRLFEAMQRSVGIQIANSWGANSSRNTTGIVERRRPGRPTKARANGEENRQGIIERHRRRRRRKRTNFSQFLEEIITKKTVLSWLIRLGIVEENEVVRYVQSESRNKMGEGKVNKEGILCSCCSRQITVGEFEIHSGFKTGKPYKHIVLAVSQLSLFDCQIEALEGRNEEEKCTYNNMQPEATAVDKNDDACMICADGGDLICCERCPSTFHPKCIFMENIPQGDWLCPYCVCKYCASGDGLLKKCVQCEKLYHSKCGGENLDLMNSPASLFCGSSCTKIYEGLRDMLGVKNNLQDGLSWTLLQRTEQPFGSYKYNKVQINSKVALAWLVMNECFLSTIDRHTRANIIQSIVYNRGSNLTRINYSGFYTAVLEKNDEIICVASIRVHGKRLAEMPFIGTRGVYRRQGMARILLNCVESALRDLEVEKLVIPSVDQLVDMWIGKYFFARIEEVRLKKELCQYNTVMFPSAVVKLHKNLAMLPDLNIGPSATNGVF